MLATTFARSASFSTDNAAKDGRHVNTQSYYFFFGRKGGKRGIRKGKERKEKKP
jgi:hypothetical protein